MHDTAYLAFVSGRNRYYETSLTKRGCRVGVHKSIGFRLAEDGIESTAYAALFVGYLTAYTRQFGRSVIRQTAVTVEDAIDLFD